MKPPHWAVRVARFWDHTADPNSGTWPSVPGGKSTLYGTCYALLGKLYLGDRRPPSQTTREFLRELQDTDSGLMIGPELSDFEAPPGVMHDREHLLFHSTCAAIPVLQQFQIPLKYPIFAAHRFCDVDYLQSWLNQRDWKNAWFEGNNILFVGQLLVYLRDFEQAAGAGAALDVWFQWLDQQVDPTTGLWGTNGYCATDAAVYGGYHQLLVYYHENRDLTSPERLVDTVLDLQHSDGGFNPHGNAGACEDVDSVDILVNVYKRRDYRRADIRHALRRCVRHILATQNEDGGFPYKRDCPQSHMGIPGTDAGPNVSTTFPTWFRVHTLALCAEVDPEHASLRYVPFRFNDFLSAGWHLSPPTWRPRVSLTQHMRERWLSISDGARNAHRTNRALAGRIKRKLFRAI